MLETNRLMEKYELSDNTLMLKGFCVGSLFYGVVLSILSSFTIILLRKRVLVALLCVFAVVWLSVFCVFSSQCCGLVCGQ